MSIISVAEIFDPQRSASLDDSYARTYERIFRVVTDGTDGAKAVLLASGMPDLWSGYQFPVSGATETDGFALCTAVRVEQQSESKRHWKVYFTYSTVSNILGDDDDNPLNQPAVITGDGQAYSVAMIQDKNNQPFLNTANDFYNPAPEVPKSRLLFNIQKNLSTGAWSPSSIVDHQNKISSASFLGFPTKSVKCEGASFAEQLEQGVTYWSATYRFLYEPNLWDPLVLLNCGSRELDPADHTKNRPITDSYGQPTGVYPLKSNGEKLTTVSKTTVTFNNFSIYDTFDFNSIGLI